MKFIPIQTAIWGPRGSRTATLWLNATVPAEVTTNLAAPLVRVVDEVLFDVVQDTEQCGNNRVETDHGRLKKVSVHDVRTFVLHDLPKTSSCVRKTLPLERI